MHGRTHRRGRDASCADPVELTGAGRTDAGVHGWGQVVTGMIPDDTDLRPPAAQRQRAVPARHRRSASVEWADADFSARFSATSRTLPLRHLEPPRRRTRCIARTSWHVPQPLDLEAMNDAAAVLIGDHDFSSFCRRPEAGRRAARAEPRAPAARSPNGASSTRDSGPITAVRDRRHVVLPPDGAQHRRHARRRRPRAACRRRRSAATLGSARSLPRRARWHRRTGSCCGTSTTAGRAGTSERGRRARCAASSPASPPARPPLSTASPGTPSNRARPTGRAGTAARHPRRRTPSRRLSLRPMIAVVRLVAAGSTSMPATNRRSIFTPSTGSSRRWARLE